MSNVLSTLIHGIRQLQAINGTRLLMTFRVNEVAYLQLSPMLPTTQLGKTCLPDEALSESFLDTIGLPLECRAIFRELIRGEHISVRRIPGSRDCIIVLHLSDQSICLTLQCYDHRKRRYS